MLFGGKSKNESITGLFLIQYQKTSDKTAAIRKKKFKQKESDFWTCNLTRWCCLLSRALQRPFVYGHFHKMGYWIASRNAIRSEWNARYFSATGGTMLKFESRKVKIHTQNATQSHVLLLSERFWILKYCRSLKSPIHAMHTQPMIEAGLNMSKTWLATT